MDPSDMSRGTRGGGYPELTKQQLMLLLIWNKLNEAYARGGSELLLTVMRVGEISGLDIETPLGKVNLSDEIPELVGTGEAIAILDRLQREGYIHTDLVSETPSIGISHIMLRGLSTKGLLDIGKFPDPDQKLAEAFLQARRMLEQESSIPEKDKRDMLDTMEKTTSLLNNGRGVGAAIMHYLGQSGGSIG